MLQDFEVTCNCGKRALILLDPIRHEFIAAKPFRDAGWYFDEEPTEHFPLGRGWNCGKPLDLAAGERHWQRRNKPIDPFEAKKMSEEKLARVRRGELAC